MEFKHIFAAVDFNESSDKALALAVDLAVRFGARLTLFHAYEIPAYAYDGASFVSVAALLAPVEAIARKKLESTLEGVQRRVPAANADLRAGVASSEILTAIDELRPDLVVVGTHGRRGVGRLLLGSVAEKVVRLSPVPVMTVRHHPSKPAR